MPAETHHRLHSAHLGNERSIWIRPPRDDLPPRHLAVVLDAELYRDRVDAMTALDALDATSAIAPTLVVFVSVATFSDRWIECPCHPPFAGFIADELLPWLTALHPEAAGCTGRTLVGLSYTGLAAAFVAYEKPGRFTRVIAQSGSFWSRDCWLADQVSRLSTPLPTAFYLEVGTRETAVNVQHKDDVFQPISQIEGVRRFRDALVSTGHAVAYSDFPGAHDTAAWRQTLPAALRWALA